eukprot:TRINITY_DN11417_c0_g1_i3.p1 TRINITY_DN11417_c0_g1~~TRINITY_DN11417_c0_g1_i3.p1  ORF type:complete len:808 (+),score=192.14 TRINITY_DN11417_c0_g1_i3:582-3005(+)
MRIHEQKFATAQSLLADSNALFIGALRLTPGAPDEEITATIRDSPFALAMQALTQWSKVMGLKVILSVDFVDRLVELLQSPVGHSEVVLELVLEVLRSSPGSFMLYEGAEPPAPALERLLAAVTRAMQALLPRIQQQAGRPAVSLEEADAERLSRWGRVAGALVEAYTQILWAEKDAADGLITFLGACFMVHPRIARSVFELWAILKDANRDSKLPPGVLENLLQHLALPCIASLVRFGRHDSPYAEDPSELSELREAQQEVIVDMFCIADGTTEQRRILTLLQEHLQSSEESKDWNGVEVMWFAFSGIAETLVGVDEQLPEVYEFVVQSIFRAETTDEGHLLTAAALLRTCGPHFQQRLRPQLVPAVQWLVGMVARIPSAASEAVQELCGYAGEHLVSHVAEFLKVVESSAPAVPAEVDASLYGALVGIARHLPADQIVPAFVEICRGTIAALAEGLSVDTEEGRQKLHRISARLLRCTLVMEQGGGEQPPSSVASKGGEPTAAARASATCLAAVLNAQWPALATPCRRLLCAAPVARDAPRGKPIFEYSDEAVQVNILALLRYAARAACDASVGGPELGAKVVELAVSCSCEGQLGCLHAASVLAANQQLATALLMPALGAICQAALAHVQAGRGEVELVPFLELIAALATTLGEELFRSPQLQMLSQLCVLATRSSDQDILKPALLFLQRLVMTRVEAVAAAHAQDVIQAVLANFQIWPRSVGAQTYRLFMALMERHEAVFLQLSNNPALPCVAHLPPAEAAIALGAFKSLRGPRLRAFLADVAAVARRENTPEVLQAYASTEN